MVSVRAVVAVMRSRQRYEGTASINVKDKTVSRLQHCSSPGPAPGCGLVTIKILCFFSGLYNYT